ncbi:hypothetical protein MJO57_01835 [Endozoicomonas sp. SCSIO W0465]|nr:hypothetical protein [Endozoicomonas sp. SCSIO W0465]USE37001.1 hypothetical protein MJO57_01835 [Endozoicomonas sp. SCSIO W0465]
MPTGRNCHTGWSLWGLPYEGEYGLELDNGAGGTPDALYYTVATGQGLSHKVSLRVHERPGGDGSDHVEVVWNGEVLETINPTDAWGEYVVTLPDTGLASTQLAIREVAGQDDGSGPLLDLITLSRVDVVENAPPEFILNGETYAGWCWTPSWSAMAISPRAMTGRCREPSTYQTPCSSVVVAISVTG